MRAGKLRHRVALQSATVTNTKGSLEESWATTATVWAAVIPLSGNELFRAQQVQSEVSTRIEMRWRSGVTPKKRMLFESRIFEILTVINVEERDRELHLMCREILS